MKNRSLYRKIYIVLVLSGILTVSFFFLLISGKTKSIDSIFLNDNSSSSIHTTSPIVSPSSAPESTILPTQDTESILPDTTSFDSFLKIVNKSSNLTADYIPVDLVDLNVEQYDRQQLRSDAARELENMFSAASNDGISLYLVSGYRNYEMQEKLQKYYQDEYGEIEASRIDCIPGASEHQLGLAVDLCTTDHVDELEVEFEETDAYKWLIAHCYEYGYILRYPKGKEEITGIKFSPWNFRYVGKEYAQKISESGLTMEEYFQ